MKENKDISVEELEEKFEESNTEEVAETPSTNSEVSEPPKVEVPTQGNASFDALGSLFGPTQKDYTPLFNAYKNIIEAHDTNINFLKNKIDKLSRAYWILWGAVLVVLIISLVR